MNILIFFAGSIITLIYAMSFVWEMKQEKILKEKELRDNKYYYARNMSSDKKKQPKRKKGSQSRIKNYNLKK
ncbi:MAG: hypothetical protein EVA37_05680 [Flavobacteriales bacterium]|nr:MAG: hypothetical protein EVA37_05680 [Flavobacteriales bacterium]